MKRVACAAVLLGLACQPLPLIAGDKPAATMLVLRSSPNPSVAGAAVTIAAVLRTPGSAGASSAAPTGAIEFFDGNTALGSAPLVDDHGVPTATLEFRTFAAGGHPVTARYAGDDRFAKSLSAPLLHIVAPRPRH